MFRRSKVTLKSTQNKPNFFWTALVVFLTVFGLVMVANASAAEAFRDFGDKLYYFRRQIVWAALGFLAYFTAANFKYQRLKILSLPLLIFTLISLILVMVPGIGIKALGAKRQLGYGNFNFQPAELAKLVFVLWSAAFLSTQKRRLPFLIILAILIILVMLEPDLGTTTVLAFTGLAIYFASGAPILQILMIGLTGLIGGYGLIMSSSYRKQRLLTFLNPMKDPLGASYHIRQILLALGSGGLTGLGLGQSRQKYEYLPEVTTDSIFAIIAEETGFLGGVMLLLIFLIFIWQGLKIAREAPDDFGKLLALGIIGWIGIQALINLAAMVALVPLTGIPLPFISYGGSSLILTLFAVGIIANISKYKIVKK